jgi:HAD superfamily hydrolase (TIGR01509 family)
VSRPGRVEAVIFDWGGTLTPFHTVDLLDLWRVAAEVMAPDDPELRERLATALASAERDWWISVGTTGLSGTTAQVLQAGALATGLDLDAALHDEVVAAHLEAWTPHTITSADAAPLLRALRERGIKTGLLSNTHWPREWHERWLERDGILELIDERVYTSDLEHTKPHPEAFRAVLDALEVAPEAAVFVGDRPIDDISGAKGLGMRAVLIPNSAVPDHPIEPDARIKSLSQLLPIIDQWI